MHIALRLLRWLYLGWVGLLTLSLLAVPLFAMLPCPSPCHGGAPWIPILAAMALGAPIQALHESTGIDMMIWVVLMVTIAILLLFGPRWWRRMKAAESAL